MNMRRLMPWLAGLVLLACSLAGAAWAFERADPDAELPEPGSTPGVVCFGYVDGAHGITSLYPAQPGRVAEVPAQEGQHVSAGDVLIRLEDVLAEARVKEAEAAVEAALVQVDKAGQLAARHEAMLAGVRSAIEAIEFRLSAAQHLSAYKQRLFREKLASASEAAVAEDQVREAGALLAVEKHKLAELSVQDPALAVREARAQAALMKARLSQARTLLDQCVIKAPAAGTVLRVFANPGELLGAGASKPAVQFCPDGPRVIRAEVDQEYAGRLVPGQAALIHDDAKAGLSWKGKLIRISNWFTQKRSVLQEPLQTNDVRTLECLIVLDGDHRTLRIGQRVRVTLGGAASESTCPSP